VVDDDEFSRLLVARHLPSPPFELSNATHGAEGLELFAAWHPDWVIIDMEMPVMGGLDAVKAMRQHEALSQLSQPAAIVMLSSNDESHAAAQAMAAGCNAFLAKPVSRERLLSTMLKLTRQIDEAAPPPTAFVSSFNPGRGENPSEERSPHAQIDASLRAEVPALLASRQELVGLMLEAIQVSDHEALRRHAHKCAGGLAMYGFEDAANLARQIERTASLREWASLRTLCSSLSRHLETVTIDYVSDL
jgi:CheY-like chemotaxis protein/HPt (histidine-containing phosphotransfer) domain-containing protein